MCLTSYLQWRLCILSFDVSINKYSIYFLYNPAYDHEKINTLSMIIRLIACVTRETYLIWIQNFSTHNLGTFSFFSNLPFWRCGWSEICHSIYVFVTGVVPVECKYMLDQTQNSILTKRKIIYENHQSLNTIHSTHRILCLLYSSCWL